MDLPAATAEAGITSIAVTGERKPTQKAEAGERESDKDRVPTRRGFFGVLKKAAKDEMVRRTSTKR